MYVLNELQTKEVTGAGNITDLMYRYKPGEKMFGEESLNIPPVTLEQPNPIQYVINSIQNIWDSIFGAHGDQKGGYYNNAK